MPESLAGRVLAGIAKLPITQGAGAGKPFEVLPWERRFVKGVLKPGVSTAALTVARGAGKSTVCAALAVAALAGPLRKPRGEVIVIASSLAQGGIVFGHAKAFLAGALAREPKRWRVRDGANAALIEDRSSGCRLRVIGSDPRRAHGLAGNVYILDEPAQWPPGSSDAMISAVRTSQGKIEGGRLIALGTRPTDPGHWFARMLEGGCDYSQIHAATADAPPFRLATWRRACPSLDHMPALRAVYESEARLAARDPSALASFRALRLNLGMSDVLREMLISPEAWKAVEADDVPALGPGQVWGIDLGGSASFSALAAFDASTGALRGLAAVGSEPSLRERGLRDGVGGLYVDLAKEGGLLVCEGQTVRPAILLRAALERFGRPAAIAADRWREGELVDGLREVGFPPAALVTRGMGYFHGGQDTRAFQAAVLEGRVRPERSQLFRAALAVAELQTDPAGNRKITKQHRRSRDDVAVAATLAIAEGCRRQASPPPAFRYGGLA